MKWRLKYNSPVILTFTIISGAVLILSSVFPQSFLYTFFVTSRGPLINPMTWIRMFTYVLGHASFEHYFSNMMLFLLIGPSIEEKYGSQKTLLIILVTAFCTALVNMIFTNNGLVGASGVVFAFIVLSSMTSFKKGEIPLTLVVILVLYLGQEVVNGIVNHDQVSQMAHIVGGLIGAVFGFSFKKDRI